jgi:hypothetical protein
MSIATSRPLAAVLPVLLVALSCTQPPVYALRDGQPVTVSGQQCRADLYDVTYSDFFDIGQPEFVISRRQGTQFRVVCGATTTNCLLNQTLEACVAMIEAEASESRGGSGYTIPE